MTQKLNNSMNLLDGSISYGVLSVASALTLLIGVGCYHATGYDRAALIAEEIPAIGGDRVTGLKSMAGAGDYYIGNDFVGLAIDGTPPSEAAGIAGAPGGGSIVDVGYISLDTSYRRVAMPCDMLERLTTVVNQDPDISLVLNDFKAINQTDLSRLEMRGQIHDPKRKLAGADWDDQGYVKNVAAMTAISLGSMSRTYSIETTITNNASSNVNIRNIGDLLFQRGGGFRILTAVNENYSGAPLSSWGVDIPGTDFTNPLLSSVRSGPVAFMSADPGANTVDCHVSLGLMPLDESGQFLVASDPQHSLNEIRPVFPERFVAGSLDTGVSLEPNKSITHRRRLFIKGGTSSTPDFSAIFYTQNTPNQATGIMNDMLAEMFGRKSEKLSMLYFYTEGTGTRTGPLPLELRFERYIGDLDPKLDKLDKEKDDDLWKLERLEWMEPPESSYSDTYGYYTTPTFTFGVFVPPGTYRIIAKNRDHKSILWEGTNSNEEDRPTTAANIVLEDDKTFFLNERISPERDVIYSDFGSVKFQAQNQFIISTRGNDSLDGFIQPMRFAISGLDEFDTKDPINRRYKSITSTFDSTARMPRPPLNNYPGPYHFVGGNSAFGVQNIEGIGGIWVVPGMYQAYGARGPLSNLESFRLDTRPGLGAQTQLLTVFQAPLPKGWIAFDTPGPSQATSGGMLPCEQLSSALADGVGVVARTELDHQTDADALYGDFTSDLSYADDYRTAIGLEPFVVGARSSILDEHGTITAYFTPVNVNARNGGARPSKGWTLADFLAQANGKYNVIIRPRGPDGAFTKANFKPGEPLHLTNPWWSETGLKSLGKRNGDFDALEIMNAGTIATSNINVWWNEFKLVRTDWFSLLNQQKPEAFTKAVGFSSGKFSVDTPVGLARTYLNIGDAELTQPKLEPILAALKSGAAVVSSGPMLDVKVGSVGPGALASVNASPSTVSLNVTLVAPDWLPVDELRIVVNGHVVKKIDNPKLAKEFEQSSTDSRFYTAKLDVPVPVGKDAWLVVEAGVPLETTGAYSVNANGSRTPWHIMMKGIYPVAITNPIFLSLRGGEYTPPGL